MELEELVADQLRHLGLLETENAILQRKVADSELELAIVSRKLRLAETERDRLYVMLGRRAASGAVGGDGA